MQNPLKYFKEEMVKFRKPIVLALMGLFVALAVVLTRLVRPIELPFLRVSFGFLATSFCSIILGPFLGAVNAAVGDIAGYFLFPSGSAFFPGFTISAFLSGILYGVFLYKKPVTLLRVALAVLSVSIAADLVLNTIWLSILYDKAWTAFFALRAIKTAIFYPIQVAAIYLLWKYLGKRIRFIHGL